MPPRFCTVQKKILAACCSFRFDWDILRMNPDLVPANGTPEFPKPWSHSVVRFLFSGKYRLLCILWKKQ